MAHAEKKQPKVVRAGDGAVLWIAAAVLMTFGIAVTADFISIDDQEHLLSNGHIVSRSLAGLGRIWSESYFGLYIPVSYSAWWITSVLSAPLFGELSAPVFHALNVAVHLINATLVYQLIRKAPSGPAMLPALAGALVFTLHPTQVESVAWVSEFRGVLSACLCLLSLNQVVTSEVQSLRDPRAKLATALFALGVLAKPSAVVLPAVLLVLNRWGWNKRWQDAVRLPVQWLILSVIALVFTKRLQPDQDLDFITPWLQRPLIAVDALGFYLAKVAWPATLGMDYGRAPELVLREARYASTWILPAGLLLSNLIWGRKKPWIRCATLLFLAVLLPVSGLLPFMFQAFSTVADRYLYLAHLATAWAFAFGLQELSQRIPMNALRYGVGLILLLVGVKSHLQGHVWRDTETLVRHSLMVNPGSWWMRQTLAKHLAQTGRNAEARELCEREAKIARADLQAGAGLQRRESYVLALKCVGDTMIAQGDQKRGAVVYMEILKDPDAERAPGDALAKVHTDLGTALFQLGLQDEGVFHLRQATELSDEAAPAMRNLARILLSQGNTGAAIQLFERALRVDPYDEVTRSIVTKLTDRR